MYHNKFLSSLREALEGNMSEQAIKDNIQYYKTYIEDEVKKGRTEKEVIEELGDPWIIAKTLIESPSGEQTYEGTVEDNVNRCEEQQNKVHIFGLDTWWKKLLLILIVLGFGFLIGTLLVGVVRLVLPILIPFLAVMFLIKLFKKK
ncbi:MAG: DUF1700 domain-containing protein [Lachnospiraceae bacterium]|nr:DUF1700 domain-containing protein [Lachnospiraceae bacterium]MDU3181066.1 DUF1700 domain-containing protein [Lachnospiraceae bacterium]